MAAPYSYDLRQKVIQAIERGMRKSEAFSCFLLESEYNRPVAKAKSFFRRVSREVGLSKRK